LPYTVSMTSPLLYTSSDRLRPKIKVISRIAYIIALLCSAALTHAQSVSNQQLSATLATAKRIADQPKLTRKGLDSLSLLLNQVDSLSKASGNKSAEMAGLLLSVKKNVRLDDLKNADKALQQYITYFQGRSDNSRVAEAWYSYGLSMLKPDPFSFRDGMFFQDARKDAYWPQISKCFQEAYALAQKMNNKPLSLLAGAQLANVYFNAHQLDEAIRMISTIMPLTKATQEVKPYMLQYELMRIYVLKSDYTRALGFAYDAISSNQNSGPAYDANILYSGQGIILNFSKKFEDAANAFEKYVSLSKEYHRPLYTGDLRYYSNVLLQLGRYKEALALMKSVDISNPLYGPSDKFELYRSLASISIRLKQYDNAEEYYLKAKALLKGAPPRIVNGFDLTLVSFYTEWKKYDKARTYTANILDSLNGQFLPENLRTAHKLLFKLDSADGKYQSAIAHLQASQDLNNKLLNESTRKAIEEYRIKYETEKKDKDITLLTGKVKYEQLQAADKEKSNQLLNATIKLKNTEVAKKQASIQLLGTQFNLQKVQAANNQKNIQLLKSQDKLQKADLNRSNIIKNSTIAGLIAALVILGLLYNQFRLNRKASWEIDLKNKNLQQLVKDKEWLLKEIHHRVKNNLQIVISLLNTQSAYLDSDVAMAAIQESQHRMRSISLIHQKLYQSDNVAEIDMFDYISDLIVYLEESFTTAKRVDFDLQVEPLFLDVAQAVPIGLILNEAITNAIKYAFSDNKQGKITIGLDESKDGMIILFIQDNGPGIPAGFDPAQSKSLGMSLMYGLSQQLGGDFKLHNEDGLVITSTFSRRLINQDIEAGMLFA